MLLKLFIFFILVQVVYADCGGFTAAIDYPPGCYWFNASVRCSSGPSDFSEGTLEVWDLNAFFHDLIRKVPIIPYPNGIGYFRFYQCISEAGVGDKMVELYYKFSNICGWAPDVSNEYVCVHPLKPYYTIRSA